MSRLLTLPRVAELVGVEYRTLHAWLRRGLLRPSVQASKGTGYPNLFELEDVVHAKVIADLRGSGLSFSRLNEAAEQLDRHQAALTRGAWVLVNGRVSVVTEVEAGEIIRRESITLVYNTEHTVRSIQRQAAEL
jgi:DNA-binding transcriptional MerR regulator